LSNAFKYTDAGSVTLTLQRKPLSDKQITLVISIADTGLGMTDKQIAVIFDDYTRFHERERSSVSGTGLGMPIVSNLVQMMNAEIEIESEVGEGTTVTISIPQEVNSPEILGKEAAEKLQLFEVYARKERQRGFVPEPMPYGKILVVDDIDTNLYVAQGLLALYSLNIETCMSGYEAIEKIKQNNVYDVIFLDHMMPGISGPETLVELRKMGYTHPIVVLTANALAGEEEGYIKSGFDAFLSKPIMTDKLNAVLHKYIKDKQPPEVIAAAEKEKNHNRQSVEDWRDDVYLFGKLRVDFVKSQKNTIHSIRNAINTGDIETARLLAHTLNGLAALIREPVLSQYAQNIEKLLAGDNFSIGEELIILENEFNHVFEKIGKTEVKGDYKGFDKNEAILILDELMPLLENRKNESLNMLDKVRAIPETAILCKQIERYKFKAALESARALKNILED